MTYSSRNDQLGGFTSSGEEVFYTFCEDRKAELAPPCGEVHQPGLPTPAGDICLGALPAVSGGRLLELCGSRPLDADSAKQFRAGTRLADGSLVYIYATRRLIASFSVNPGLYLLRPGAHAPVKLFDYPPAVQDLRIPSRLMASGGHYVVTFGTDGPELITIDSDNSASRRALVGVEAVDPAAPFGARVVDGMIQRLDLLTGESSDLMSVPTSDGWEDAQATALGMAGQSVVVAQLRVAGEQLQSRLVLLRSGSTPHVVTSRAGAEFSRLAVAPDARTVVAQVDGDLYRYPLP
jgi:hypothetical protein